MHYKKYFLLAARMIISLYCYSQPTVTISGFVSAASTGERLAGANVYLPELKRGTTCNEFGFFSTSVPAGKVTILFSFVGFEALTKVVELREDTLFKIELYSRNVVEEVKISAGRGDFLLSQSMGTHRLSGQQVEQIPAVLGEPDLLKAIQLLPGVSFATEGSTGFSVRGGNPEQTLIRLDGVPVYNVNHLWGFMSAFNNDAINDTRLYKGNLPARFGGRMGSVLDVTMKEGNMKRNTGSFSLSPIAGRINLEGPLVKDKASFMVSGRTTWANLLLSAFQKLENQNSEGAQHLTYGFWDINGKANWIIDPHNRVYLSFYTGRDAFVQEHGGGRFDDYIKFSYSWQNLTSVLRWNHISSPVMFANFSFYNSRFRQVYLNRFDEKGSDSYKGYNNLNDWTTKGDFNWYPHPGNSFRFGYELAVQQFNPEIISYRTDTSSFKLNTDVFTRNILADVYGSAEVALTGKATATIGIRAGNLAVNSKNYFSVRPRLSVRYLISEQLSTKASWSRMKQFLHQLQNTTLGIPTELWVSTTEKIEPGTSDLFSAGLFRRLGKYEFSSEGYYTLLKNVVQYREGTLAAKEQGESWEDHVTQGKGTSYGMEFMAEKTTGALTGWVSYTLSKSTRQFSEINFGRKFPYAYDRRHQLNIHADLDLGKKKKNNLMVIRNFAGTFSFASGKYMTLAEQEYQAMPLPLMEGSRHNAKWFSRRSLINSVNNYQMPDFHHLNLSYRIERHRNEKNNTWNFSVYNIYNRLNPWYYYKKDNRMKQITLFPVIPSVTYTYRW